MDIPAIAWSLPLLRDTSLSSAMRPVVAERSVLCGAEFGWNERASIFCVNRKGKLIWRNDVSSADDCTMLPTTPGPGTVLHKNALALLCNADPVVINIRNGGALWNYQVPGGDHGPFISGWHSLIFQTYVSGANPFSKSTLVKTDIRDGIWDTLYEALAAPGNSIELCVPAATKLPDGDTIVLFMERSRDTGTKLLKADCVAFNLSKRSVLWRLENADPSGLGTVFPPQIFDDRILLQCAYGIVCVDLIKGESCWNWTPGNKEDLLLGECLLHEGVLYVKTGGRLLAALDVESGSELWRLNDFSGAADNLVIFKQSLYLVDNATGTLYAVNNVTGTLKWSLTSPNKVVNSYARFQGGIALDKVSGNLYATDRLFLLCIPLN